MNIDQVNLQNDLIKLAQSAGAQLQKSGRALVSACPLHKGDNPHAFSIYSGKDGRQHFKCFTRAECNRFGSDVVAFVRARDGVDFKSAVRSLAFSAQAQTGERRAERVVPPIRKLVALPDEEWQSAAWVEVDKASEQLLSDPDCTEARAYLERRGITRATWLAWNLGSAFVWDGCLKRKRCAIVLPWWDVNAAGYILTAVKYRFVVPESGGLRYSALTGSVPVLYGLNYTIPGQSAILMVEGELNALSCWQLLNSRGISVVSFGSESGGRPEILRSLAARFQRVFVWADEPKRAIAIQSQLAGASALRSPEMDGLKWDANEMLKGGSLRGFLERLLF